jgi:hypothetical protein
MPSQNSPGQSLSPIYSDSFILGEILAELRVHTILLHAMSGIKDDPDQLRADPSMKWLSNRADPTNRTPGV